MLAGYAGRASVVGLDEFLEQRRLIQFVVTMLMFDVPSDDLFVYADGRDEISPGPQRVGFIQPMFPLDFLLEPGGGFPLQYLHGIRDGISWRCQQATVYMVILYIELDDFPVLPLADGFEYSF